MGSKYHYSGPSLEIEMGFRWRADDGPTLNGGFVIFRGFGPILLRNAIFL